MTTAPLERICVPASATVRQAVEAIDAGGIEIALVVDERRRLLATVTDGDVRRALLRGTTLDDPVADVAHDEPVTAAVGTDQQTLLTLMTEHGIEQVPLMEEGCVKEVAFIRDLIREPDTNHPVVLMAGGQGARLRPLTEDVPKPMLPVGDRPLLETVVGQVREGGFSKIVLAVNYRSEVIEDHFGDGSEHGVDIAYVHEPEPLGSAGALRLAREHLDRPFIVMNADLLTRVNLGSLLRFHLRDENVITVAVRQYAVQVPYGVVDLDERGGVTELKEKPTMRFYVNAGIYAVDPRAVEQMPTELREIGMTELVDAALARGDRVGSFPIREYWLDVGHLSDYERADADHATFFSAPR